MKDHCSRSHKTNSKSAKMLRRTTSGVVRTNSSNFCKNTVLRSRRTIPQYSEVNNDENRFGDFTVVDHHANQSQPVIYYFIEITNPIQRNNQNYNGSNNSNNNNNNNSNISPPTLTRRYRVRHL
ncbi:hypothetical protein KAFR_0F01920 [Kazachstania africana CBS 2517]|uniref:Uncharacterized protein n=1 Tax=Kazachstania africana (strain ATCC 22294 / BCRC 22015 / CBS 2517 / CECT 1963 / NBRC 1671 / NRRL Y-8276) TaxID=1071382 RepID=H2AWN9_KAZAF|nr:hypothetical protein KAFR_0F01920 [Kazachstania africana CBS 2517]CCF58789.1 hypothetical protein KAFR_0F01920 [Kazachstania africana CBS 2517]